MTVELSTIDHIGAPTWDADAASSFFQIWDVPVIYEEVNEEYNVRAVFLDIDGVYLEFLEPTGPGATKTFLERHGPGFQHVAYEVGDIDHTVAELRDQGVTFQTEAPVPGAGSSRIIFIEEHHTGGFQTELVERTGRP